MTYLILVSKKVIAKSCFWSFLLLVSWFLATAKSANRLLIHSLSTNRSCWDSYFKKFSSYFLLSPLKRLINVLCVIINKIWCWFLKNYINELNSFMMEVFIIYRNQSIDCLCKSTDWFLYDSDLRHERVNAFSALVLCFYRDMLLTFFASSSATQQERT